MRDWKHYLLEFFTVLLGVFLAFAADEYRAASERDALLSQYTSALREELKQNRTQLDSLIALNDRNVKLLFEMLYRFDETRLKPTLQALAQQLDFWPQTAAYDALKSSGYLAQIESIDVQTQIASVYLLYQKQSQVDGILNDFSTAYVMPFFMREMDLKRNQIRNPRVYEKTEFQNLMTGYAIALKQATEHYLKSRKATIALIQELH